MSISATYEALRQIAETEFADIVVQDAILRLPTGDPQKLRLALVDNSIIDVFISRSGRYSYHWDRRPAGKTTIYRHDNAPHAAWQSVATFPHHFHDGREKNVVASHISQEPTKAVREFCVFARQKLLEEAGEGSEQAE
jgi:hypothetical protein